MYGFFVVCAAIGGTVLIMQFILNLMGLAGGGGDGTDMGHGDVGDVSGHFDGSAGDGGGDFHHGDIGDMGDGHGDIGEMTDGGDVTDVMDGHGSHAGHGSHGAAENPTHVKVGLQIARYVTLQTVVAFFTFFGLGGWWALEADRTQPAAMTIAVGAGLAFMFAVGYAFRSLRKLEQSGNESIHHTVGCRGRVYLRIPANASGVGKATITSQGRTMELRARTPGEELKTGTTVRVSRVIDRQTVEVLPVNSTAELAASSK